MPWRETSPVDQRGEFIREFIRGLIREYRRGRFHVAQLGARYHVSRRTA